MASKGKSKLKKHEIKFGSKCIDLKRFAYDVFVYSAKKFNVPDNCIGIWEGSENDYGCPEFCMVMCRKIFKFQIAQRYSLHSMFKDRYESNELGSLETIKKSMQEAINKLTACPVLNIIDKVALSLSVSCELILFLFSKNSSLYLKELAAYWFDCWFHLEKKKFEKAGGLEKWYGECNKPKFDRMDHFYNAFIKGRCHYYQDSAENEKLKETFYQSAENAKKIVEGLSPKECEEIMKFLTGDALRGGHRGIPGFTVYEVADVPDLQTEPSPDEDSESNPLSNPGLGIDKHEDILKALGSSAADTLSPNLPVTSPPKPAKKHHRGPTAAMKKSKDRKRSVSVADEATSYQNIPGASSQETEKHRLSSQQKTESDFMEEGLRRLSLGSRGSKHSNEKKPNVSVADNQASSQNIPK